MEGLSESGAGAFIFNADSFMAEGGNLRQFCRNHDDAPVSSASSGVEPGYLTMRSAGLPST
jgi:hypothetical protein